MKTLFKAMALLAMCGMVFFACSTQDEVNPNQPEPDAVPADVIDKLNSLGFNTVDMPVIGVDNGYIVERDIFIGFDDLNNIGQGKGITEEHYSTTNLVTGLPRTINVFVSGSFQSQYFTATDNAIARYNAESLQLTFARVTSASAADISIVPSPWWYRFFGILGSAGFPTAGGDPFNQIQLTTAFYNNVTDLGALTTTIAHEMGHCIGMRHTDYMDRSFSCGGATDNEGDGGVGANYIPGTPTGPEAGSWMLACSDGTDRPFTSGDQTALAFLY